MHRECVHWLVGGVCCGSGGGGGGDSFCPSDCLLCAKGAGASRGEEPISAEYVLVVAAQLAVAVVHLDDFERLALLLEAEHDGQVAEHVLAQEWRHAVLFRTAEVEVQHGDGQHDRYQHEELVDVQVNRLKSRQKQIKNNLFII